MIKTIQKHIEELSGKDENKFGMNAYHYHFVPVVKNAVKLAEKINADREIVEIAAWLHDVGSILGDYENHHVSGAEYAGEYLRKLNYPEEKIKQVQHCILTHRSSKKIKRDTIEAECIASADAMAHIDEFISLFYLALVVHKLGVFDAKKFVKKKLQNGWDKLVPEAKEIVKDKYKAAMLLIN